MHDGGDVGMRCGSTARRRGGPFVIGTTFVARAGDGHALFPSGGVGRVAA